MTAPFVDEDDIDTPPPANDQSGTALRKFANEQKALAAQYAKDLAELRATLAMRDAESVFKELGVPDKGRKFYSGEPTKDAITAWVKENADVFGLSPDGEDITITPEKRQQFDDLSGVQAAGNLGLDKDGAVSREVLAQQRADLLSKPRSSLSDLDKVLANMGVPNTPLMAPQF